MHTPTVRLNALGQYTPLGANTRLTFDCYYQGGGSLMNQSFCPAQLNGEPLLYTESRLVEDVTATPFPWWILLLLFAVLASQKKH